MTDRDLVASRDTGISGEQRIYRWGDWGLSVVNGPALHAYQYAREAAVVRFTGESPFAFELDYSTPLTSDVAVFDTDEAADAFVEAARLYFTVEAKKNDPTR